MKNIKTVLKLLTIISIIFLIIGLLTGCGNKEKAEKAEYEEPIKNMFDGMTSANLDTYMKAFPDFINYEITQEELTKMMNVYTTMYGQDVKISYEIEKSERLTSTKLAEVTENIKTYYDYDCTITKGYRLTIKRTAKGSLDENSSSIDANVYKIDGKWYTISF